MKYKHKTNSIRLFPIFLLMILFLSNRSSAQITGFNKASLKAVQYEKTEWDIQLKTTFDNPYWASDVALDMKIKTPSGKTLTLPCFYVDGESGEVSKWKARFTPRETGSYSARFVLCNNGKETSESESTSFSVSTSTGKGFLSLNNYWTFRFDNGELFRGIGENICWEARSNDDSKYFKELHEKPKYNFDYLLGQLAKNGGNYFRVWMCSWSLPFEHKNVSRDTDRYTNTDQHFNPGAIQRMDELVELCDSLGLYMMLCIDQAGNYRGTMEWSNYHVKNGGFATNAFEFLTLPKSREQYKNRLRYLIARWGYSPSIGAWEFFNEIDYLGYGPNDSVLVEMHQAIVDWHTNMAAYFKQNDPYQHLITTSVSHRDIIGLNEIDDIDFNQKHIYAATGKMPGVINEYLEKYNKPYVIGEFGYEWDWSKNFNDFAHLMDSDYKRGLWLGLFNPTPILPLSWWWEYFDDRGLFPYFSHVNEIYNNMMIAGKGSFKKVAVETVTPELETYAVQCGSKVFVYLFNKGEKIKDIELKIKGVSFSNANTQVFNCETGQCVFLNKPTMKRNSIKTNELELDHLSDMILIFEHAEK